MSRSRARRAIALLATVAVIGCARRVAPEPLPLDRYTCARCGMMISEIVDAAEYVSPKEETRFYDDLGCAEADAGSVPTGGRFFVRANGGADWISAGDAFFARTGDRTPMGYGFRAFSSGGEAQGRDREAKALRWEEVGKK